MSQPNDGISRSRMRTVDRQTPQLCTSKVAHNEARSRSRTFGKHELNLGIGRTSVSQRGVNALQELALVEWLGQIAEHSSLEGAGTNGIVGICRYQHGGIFLPNKDRLWCRSRPLIFGMSKST